MAETSIKDDLCALALNAEGDFVLCSAICLAVSRLAEIYDFNHAGQGVLMLMEQLEDRLRERAQNAEEVKRIAIEAISLVETNSTRRSGGPRPRLERVELDRAP